MASSPVPFHMRTPNQPAMPGLYGVPVRNKGACAPVMAYDVQENTVHGIWAITDPTLATQHSQSSALGAGGHCQHKVRLGKPGCSSSLWGLGHVLVPDLSTTLPSTGRSCSSSASTWLPPVAEYGYAFEALIEHHCTFKVP